MSSVPEVIAMFDDVKLYWMFALIGSVPVGVTVSRSGDWGVDATLGAVMVVWALYGLAQNARWRLRHPRTPATH